MARGFLPLIFLDRRARTLKPFSVAARSLAIVTEHISSGGNFAAPIITSRQTKSPRRRALGGLVRSEDRYQDGDFAGAFFFFEADFFLVAVFFLAVFFLAVDFFVVV
jgi:hypothetical protein